MVGHYWFVVLVGLKNLRCPSHVSRFSRSDKTDLKEFSARVVSNNAIHWPIKAIHNRSGNPEIMENQNFDV